MDRPTIRLAQTPPPGDILYGPDGIYAGLVWPDRTWQCGNCLQNGQDGSVGLLAHHTVCEAGVA